MNKENINSNINCKIRGHRLHQETSDAFISSFVFQKRLHAIYLTTFPCGTDGVISKSLRVSNVRKQNSSKRKLNSAEQKDHWLRAIDLLFTRLFKLTSGSPQSDPVTSPLDHANSFLLVMHVLVERGCGDCCALNNISVAEGIPRVFQSCILT